MQSANANAEMTQSTEHQALNMGALTRTRYTIALNYKLWHGVCVRLASGPKPYILIQWKLLFKLNKSIWLQNDLNGDNHTVLV